MKAFKVFLLIFVLALIVTVYAIGTDHYNGAISVTESYSSVKVTFAPSMVTDSTGQFHNKPLFIGDCNDGYAYVVCIANAGSDHNIIFHYSNDLKVWLDVVATGLDLVTNAVRYDTLGIGDQVAMKKYNWLVIEDDGQAGANTTDLVTTTILFAKDSYVWQSSSGNFRNVAYTVDASKTNP